MNATVDGFRLAVADAARAHRAGRRSSAGARLAPNVKKCADNARAVQ
jgi:hypothetical protein